MRGCFRYVCKFEAAATSYIVQLIVRSADANTEIADATKSFVSDLDK